jgi:hypothetical protein
MPMLSLLAAATMLQPVAATVRPAGDPDMRCMAAYLFAVGQMTDDPTASEEDKSSAIGIVMYYFGKVHGRDPKVEIKGPIQKIAEGPNYLAEELKPDLERCGAEYEQRGKELSAF